MRVIGYTYEADIHCVDCTKARAAKGGFTINLEHPCEPGTGTDEYGVPYAAEDNEGNLVHPVFSTDELTGDCGDCGEPIE